MTRYSLSSCNARMRDNSPCGRIMLAISTKLKPVCLQSHTDKWGRLHLFCYILGRFMIDCVSLNSVGPIWSIQGIYVSHIGLVYLFILYTTYTASHSGQLKNIHWQISWLQWLYQEPMTRGGKMFFPTRCTGIKWLQRLKTWLVWQGVGGWTQCGLTGCLTYRILPN